MTRSPILIAFAIGTVTLGAWLYLLTGAGAVP